MRYYFLALGTVVIVCVGCVTDGTQAFPNKGEFHAPPAEMMARPGPMVDGPGPGVMPMLAHAPPPPVIAAKSTQVRFTGPAGMQIGWLVPTGYAENQLIAPGRFNFPQAATYRLKFKGVPGREGLVLYPTLQLFPAHPTTDAYLSHNSVPIEITDEDLDHVEANNFVTKVIYLPAPRFQELAIAGVETLVSTRLDPGIDPVAEAQRRGTIMAVLRLGNMDLEVPGRVIPGMRPPVPPGAVPPGMVPPGAVPPGVVPPGEFVPPADPQGLPAFPSLPEGGEDVSVPQGHGVQQVSYQIDGSRGQYVPPMPIAIQAMGMPGVPNPMIVGGSGLPGQPPPHPVAGVGPVPAWGMPITSTAIGLPGAPYLPHGGPAGLKTHTMRNLTKVDIGEPVSDFLIDVKHEPGLKLPHPVSHVQYHEKHPVYRPGEASYPAWQQSPGPVPPPQPAPQYYP